MALQTSGAISLNDIHVEAGGSSGTNCSINDADIRGLINKASGATMSFNEWYGASASLGTTGLAILEAATDTDEYNNVTYKVLYRNFFENEGSIATPSSFTDSNGNTRTIREIDIFNQFRNTSAASSGDAVTLQLQGSVSNSGWSTMTFTRLNSSYTNPVTTTFYRTSASYSGGSYAVWTWSSGGKTNWSEWRGYITFA